MATLKLDRWTPDVAIPQIVETINHLMPVGMRVKVAGKPPKIGSWKKVYESGGLTEYERIS